MLYSKGKPKEQKQEVKKLFIYFAGKKFKIMESFDGELSVTKLTKDEEATDQINVQPLSINQIIIS